MNKYLLDIREYIFGSEKFCFDYFNENCYPIDYEFIFDNLELYFPKFDENNIPYSADKIYNFSGISGFALANFNRYLKTGDLKYKGVFLNQIKYIESYSQGGFYPSFQDFLGINSPWYSSLFQGLVASCYIRAFLLTNNEKYIFLAEESIQFILRYDGSQNLIKKVENIYITQEYPGNKVPNVLNGHLSFIIGALETNKYLNLHNQAEINLNQFLKPLDKFLELCSKKKWSIYNFKNSDKYKNYSTTNYHNLHISQVRYIALLTGSTNYDKIIINWQEGRKSFLARTHAMFQKIKYKFLNEN